jgi:hypothetical protein
VILPLTPDDEVRGWLNAQEHIIYTGGHTHVQFIRHFGLTFHFNPGSVGVVYRHDQKPESDLELCFDPWAEYAILSANGGRLGLEFRRVPFDLDQFIEIYRSSGRPHSDQAIRQYGG